MRWHTVYRRFVLGRHYRFAREALVPHSFVCYLIAPPRPS